MTPEQLEQKQRTITEQKGQFAASAVQLALIMRQFLSNAQTLKTIYFEKGYNIGGENEITDADLINIGTFDAADLVSFVTAVEQIVTEAQAPDKQWVGRVASISPSSI